MKELTRAVLRDKIYACWLGKNIGGTLGAPVEGRMEEMNLTFFPQIPDGQALPNDDLDLQLLNLHAAEQYGVGLRAEQIGREWLEHVRFPWDEYGYALTALRCGFIPPFAGMWDNPFTHCMGAPIRSEIWAAACPGRPELAAYFAWQDAVVDHAGGEGVFSEIFNAVIESLAFVWDDSLTSLVRAALAYIPADSRTARAVGEVLSCYDAGLPIADTRARVLEAHGSSNFTDAPQNIAFTVMGILWGENFEDALLKTVNLGYDTDCTVATCASLWGILYGSASIPAKWSDPVGDAIVLSAAVRGFAPPSTLDALTDRTLLLGDRLSLEDPARFVMTEAEQTDFAVQRWTLPLEADPRFSFCVELRYDDAPSVSVGGETKITVTLCNRTTDRWTFEPLLDLPDGFATATVPSAMTLLPGEQAMLRFTLYAVHPAPINHCRLILRRINDGSFWTDYSVGFTLLRTAEWTLDGVPCTIDGTLISFRGAGEHVAETMLDTPAARMTRLFAASVSPLRVELDGETIINCPSPTSDMPAYHRVQRERRADLMLSAGRHRLRVILPAGENDAPFFRFAAAAAGQPSEPGKNYRLIDDVLVIGDGQETQG